MEVLAACKELCHERLLGMVEEKMGGKEIEINLLYVWP